jgi:YVTN family beta-propeller protein
MSLQLKYVFTPDPNPIRASMAGANPNIIGLEVMILNPGEDPVSLEMITITIPAGQEGEHTLSNNPNLPDPEYDRGSFWVVSRSGNTFRLTPPSKGIVDPFCFKLSGIQINNTPGDVPVTIIEASPPAPKVEDSETYYLTKKPFDCPVTNFHASQPSLYDRDECVTLFWTCTPQGREEEYSYSVHSDTWQSDDCLNTGSCCTCDDGEKGVLTGKLQKTTVFELDVIKKDSDGHRYIAERVHTTVHVFVPKISQNSSRSEYLRGRIVILNWLAFNAERCAVQFDGKTIDENAPTDTYRMGYVIAPPDQSGTHRVDLIAYGRSGVTATWTFLGVEIKTGLGDDVNLPTPSRPMSVAVTPDSSLALVTDRVVGQIFVIEISTLKVERIEVTGTPHCTIAITPDGQLALATRWYNNGVSVINIAQRNLGWAIGVASGPRGIAITPDGTQVLVANYKSHDVAVMDLKLRQTIARVPIGPPVVTAELGYSSIAITPDGKLAFVSYINANIVTVLDLKNLQAKPQSIAMSDRPRGIVITPDGTLVLVLTQTFVAVIGVATQKVEPTTIPCGQNCTGIAIPPEGGAAFVTDAGIGANYGSLKIIDIAARKVLPEDISLFTSDPMGIAISADKNHDRYLTVIATFEGVSVW